MQPQGDSIWGNINLCIEIALNIYYLCGEKGEGIVIPKEQACLLYTSPSPRDVEESRMPSSA